MTVDELVMQIQQMGFSMGLKDSTMVPIIGKIREMEKGLLKLTDDRNEARRIACGALASGGHDLLNDPNLSSDDARMWLAYGEADTRGWDCIEGAIDTE